MFYLALVLLFSLSASSGSCCDDSPENIYRTESSLNWIKCIFSVLLPVRPGSNQEVLRSTSGTFNVKDQFCNIKHLLVVFLFLPKQSEKYNWILSFCRAPLRYVLSCLDFAVGVNKDTEMLKAKGFSFLKNTSFLTWGSLHITISQCRQQQSKPFIYLFPVRSFFSALNFWASALCASTFIEKNLKEGFYDSHL